MLISKPISGKRVKIMLGNALLKVSSCSENDALTLAYYLYQLTLDVIDVERDEECQVLYNALINRLNLNAHAENVLNAIISHLVKTKVLTPFTPSSSRYRHPFMCRGSLKNNYREDQSIYENCGRWETETKNDINLIRVLFSGSKFYFSQVVALTFFTNPETFTEKSVVSKKIQIPQRIKNAIEDISAVQFVSETLKLSASESKLLNVAFKTQSVKEIYEVCNNFFNQDSINRIEIYSKCSGLNQKEIRLLLKKDQKLKSFGLLDSDGNIDEDAIDAIYEKDLRLYFFDIVKNEKSVKAYEPDSFSVSQKQTDVAVQLLKSKNSCNILLYGAAGSGKTEYAKALVKQAGLKMSTYKNELEISKKQDNVEAKALSRLNCYLSLKKDDSVLVVDEAENVLQTKGVGFFGMPLSSPQKGTVNKMLETSENKVIWIVNYTNEIDESTLRRFTYSIKFQSMPKETLRSIAEGKLKNVRIPVNLKNDVLDMCGKYQITGASVDNVVKAISSLDYQKGNESKVKTDIKSVLEANSSLLYGKKKIRDAVKKSYDLSVLNTSVAASEIVEMVKAAEDYRIENQDEESDGIRMLFYGLSGTGKTELARYIALTLGKPLLLKRCSDLLGPYVGQTERMIAEAFEEAESTGSILLFDEADSFFADRTGAKQSWERTLVNEFLTQMEEFSGICICTTNLRKIMDPAMQRRFHIISEFKALNSQGISTLLSSFFSKFNFSEEQIKELSGFSTVTPGDFGSVSGKIRFVPKEKLNSQYIIGELVKIQDEKRKNGVGQIGFAS